MNTTSRYTLWSVTRGQRWRYLGAVLAMGLTNLFIFGPVLVSGGGGSIGSELCRQIAELSPSPLYVVDNSEFNLYSIELELHDKYPAVSLHAELGDVCDVASVRRLFAERQPDIVFHAAA